MTTEFQNLGMKGEWLYSVGSWKLGYILLPFLFGL